MFKSRFLIPLSFVLLAAIGFTGCTEDPCDGVDCGAGGVPQEDTVFGSCECLCDAGFELVGGTCVTDACNNVECGLGTPTSSAAGDCFCDCPEGTENIGDGNGCVTIVDCDASNCINGDCVNGSCECGDDYEGEDCNTLSVAKFIGVWTITENCIAEDVVPGVCENYEDTYSFEITENGTSTTDVVVNNFLGIDGQGDAFIPFVIANITGDSIVVTTQASTSEFYNYFISGEGEYSIVADVETVMYSFNVNEMDEFGASTCIANCTSIWTKN